MYSCKEQKPICSQKPKGEKILLQDSIQNWILEGQRDLIGNSSPTVIQPIMARLSHPMHHRILPPYRFVCSLLLMAVPTCRKACPSSDPAPSCSLSLCLLFIWPSALRHLSLE